jgi:histidinol-phosphate aminotransferase
MDFIRPELMDNRSSFTVSEITHRAKLDQNESPVDLPLEVKNILLQDLQDAGWNRYPQPKEYYEAREIFASALGFPADRIFIGMGADQLILSAYHLSGGPGRTARVFEPTYPMFRHYARITSTQTDVAILGPGYRIEPEHLEGDFAIVHVVSPNNPTGNLQDREIVRNAVEGGGLVLVDEAYAGFSGCTYCDLIEEYDNVLVARSLSKSLLAGARIGYGIAHPDVIAILDRIHTVPYHLNLFSLAVIRHYPELIPHFERVQAEVIRERDLLYERMVDLPVHPYPSHANFILFRVDRARRVYRDLLDRGVRIRDVGGLPGLEGHLRVTVGTGEENRIFLEALKEVLTC